MTEIVDLTRRNTLKMIGGLPLLPLATGTISSVFGSSMAAAGEVTRARFVGMDAPSLDDVAEMATTLVKSAIELTYADGSTKTFKLGYQPLFITGESVPDGNGGTLIAGGYYDINNRPILDVSAEGQEKPQLFSDCPDGSSLLTVDGAAVDGVKGNPVFHVVQFEYMSKNAAGVDTYKTLPSPMAILTLDQDPETGRLKLVKYFPVDSSPINGLWTTCGASITPWNTHLSSEEYEPDATKAKNDKTFRAYSQNLYGDPEKANPYHYGHMPEVTVNPDGTGTIAKHYCMGRISHELVQVMPDERTALMGDDATNGGLFMFVADEPKKLDAGALYVAKWNQKSAENGGSADLSWVKLGHATSDEIEALANKLTAADIVDVKHEDPNDGSYTKIPYGGKTEWVKFVPGQELAAAFLETHRYAPYKGGSMGFTKMEGTTVNAKDKIAYSAMSYIQEAMKDGSGDVKVKGPTAGIVYYHKLSGGQKDDTGAPINSEWVPVFTEAALVGKDLDAQDDLGNYADPNQIANPDNIKFNEDMRTLFIGEDSGMHVNNFLWAYNVDTKELTRILSTPAAAESTGLHAVDKVNGFTYIMSNFQHPGDWELKKDAAGNVTGGLHAKVYQILDALMKKNYADKRGKLGAAVGYLTGMPSVS